MARGAQLKYDWEALRLEFITGHWPTLVSFGNEKGISYTYIRKHTKGWHEAKKSFLSEVRAKAVDAAVHAETITTHEQAKLLSEVEKKMIKQLKDLSALLDAAQEKMKKWSAHRISEHLRKLERNIIEMAKTVELFSGGVTARSESGAIQRDKLEDFDRKQKIILKRIQGIKKNATA